MSSDDRFKRLKQSAGRYTAYAERAPKQVIDKLMDWGASTVDAEKIVAQLTKEGFINVDRFAQAFCRDKCRFNKWGRIKIRHHLRNYGLSESEMQAGLSAIDEEEYQCILSELATHKWQRTKGKTELDRKQKTVRFLMQRGFEADGIRTVMDELA